jgi:hypothetical protein
VVIYFVYSLWLLCLLPSAGLVACPSLNASLSWTGPFCNIFLSLSVVYFLYHFEYRVVGFDVCVIHLQSCSFVQSLFLSFFSLTLQPQFGLWPTSMKFSVSLQFSRS